MESLGDLLAPYSGKIAKFAATVTCIQFLSGIFLLNDVRKVGTSDKFPVEPFLGGLVLTILSMKLGSVIGDPNMVKINTIGFVLNTVFAILFYWYASDSFKTRIRRKVSFAAAFVIICFAYAAIEHPVKLEFRLGMLVTSLLMVLIGSPLLHLNKIIAAKSTAGMPFPIILSGTVVTASWAVYGISIKNQSVAYQNLFLFCLSGIQLSLFAIYPRKPGHVGTQPATASAMETKKSN